MKQKVAFIGLGVMGYPMAGHLANAGYTVVVFNRSLEKTDKWSKTYPVTIAKTAAEAARASDIVFVCVGNDEDVESVLCSEHGVLTGLAPEGIVVDHTTTSATLAVAMHEHSKKIGCFFLDAPVSGGELGAQKGALTIMAGGSEKIYHRVEALMACYSRHSAYMGPPGYGQLTKMVNQICLAGLIQGLSEGLYFANSLGLNSKQIIKVISKGAAQSWQMDNRHQTMIDDNYEHGFAVDWMRKDLKYALDEAQKNGINLPITEIVDRFYEEIQAMEGGRWDTSSLLKRLRLG
ncbi:MAG TPA: NAD(P)-dependent oxidoreductase [Pseudomonadales bacterium]|nr:NAD(P)-dependent oxidoreductase [Pseudomonadales bacterium]